MAGYKAFIGDVHTPWSEVQDRVEERLRRMHPHWTLIQEEYDVKRILLSCYLHSRTGWYQFSVVRKVIDAE